jgi:hypothetical protein
VLPREKILQALRLEPFLPTYLIARLFYHIRKDGQVAEAPKIRPKKTSNKVYTLEPGYWPAHKLLRAMLKDKQIRKHDIAQPGAVALWSLPKKTPPKQWYNREHEIDCAELFTALAKTKKLTNWDSKWTDEEYENFAQDTGLYYDRRFELSGSDTVYFLEVDRGSEDMDTLKEKCRKYVRLAKHHPKEKILIVFTAQHYESENPETLKKRVHRMITEAIQPHRSNELFVIVPHEVFKRDPLGQVCITPGNWDKCRSLI